MVIGRARSTTRNRATCVRCRRSAQRRVCSPAPVELATLVLLAVRAHHLGQRPAGRARGRAAAPRRPWEGGRGSGGGSLNLSIGCQRWPISWAPVIHSSCAPRFPHRALRFDTLPLNPCRRFLRPRRRIGEGRPPSLSGVARPRCSTKPWSGEARNNRQRIPLPVIRRFWVRSIESSQKCLARRK